jgi:hypothetical protein
MGKVTVTSTFTMGKVTVMSTFTMGKVNVMSTFSRGKVSEQEFPQESSGCMLQQEVSTGNYNELNYMACTHQKSSHQLK